MLKNDLLLDSTGPFGDTLNTDIVSPEPGSMGVPQSWYVLRVSYSRTLKIREAIDAKGIRTFVPMM